MSHALEAQSPHKLAPRLHRHRVVTSPSSNPCWAQRMRQSQVARGLQSPLRTLLARGQERQLLRGQQARGLHRLTMTPRSSLQRLCWMHHRFLQLRHSFLQIPRLSSNQVGRGRGRHQPPAVQVLFDALTGSF